GDDSLSMNSASRPKVKAVILSIDREWAIQLLEDFLLLDSPHGIKSCVDLALRNAGFGRYLRPVKSSSAAMAEQAVS
ncbi:hypothetical protein R0K18_28530, partial [Pantoea sp. SIMBA_133]